MSDRSSPFRSEALAHQAGQQREGVLLRLSPGWARWSFWLIVAVFVAGIGYVVVGRLAEYATGPAVIRVDGRIDLTARFEGTVAEVSVQPGQRVAEGQPLVQFFMEQEHAELQRIRKEFELQLLKQLRDPTDASARQAMSSLSAQRELATTRMSERLIRAPRGGVISEVHIRPGQHLGIGELIVTIVGDDAQLSMVALLPGRYRPMLRPGMPLRFELVGYRYEYRELTIDSIGDEIVGPAEAKRYLGPGVADSIAIDEPVVLVRARLPSAEFSSNGEAFHYFDGLHAQAQARVRSEPIIMTLLPELRGLFRHGS
ncbi:MAG: putative efflux rane fusion protein [bacterium]|nr:putative efflux rane fusion protein [bacterium]